MLYLASLVCTLQQDSPRATHRFSPVPVEWCLPPCLPGLRADISSSFAATCDFNPTKILIIRSYSSVTGHFETLETWVKIFDNLRLTDSRHLYIFELVGAANKPSKYFTPWIDSR